MEVARARAVVVIPSAEAVAAEAATAQAAAAQAVAAQGMEVEVVATAPRAQPPR